MTWDKLSDLEKGYIIGIIDGEGYIGIGKCRRKDWGTIRYSPIIRVQMTDYNIIRFLHQTFGGSYCYKIKTPLKHKDQWQWAMDFQGAFEFCKNIVFLLRIKKEQAKILIEYYENGEFKNGVKLSEDEINFRENCYLRMKQLNRRGK